MKRSKITWWLLVFLCSAICCGLGLWQLARKELKESLITQRILSNTYANYNCGDPLPYYSIVQFKAKIIWSQLMTVYTTINGQAAYKIILPALCNNNKSMLVDVGIIESYKLNTYINMQDQELEISGWIMPTEPKPKFISHESSKDNIWVFVDIARMYSYRNLLQYNFYIRSTYNTEIGLGYQKLPDLRNDHLEYAITWFVLGALILILGFLKIYKDRARD